MIHTTTREQIIFSDAIKNKYIDAVIPLPGKTVEEQKQLITECQDEHDFDNAIYWENEQGKHGWACPNCGTVVQWG